MIYGYFEESTDIIFNFDIGQAILHEFECHEAAQQKEATSDQEHVHIERLNLTRLGAGVHT